MVAHQAVATQSGSDILLAGRFAVDTTARLPEFDAPTAQAFEAREGHDHDGSLYALVCGAQLPPRIDVMDALTGLMLPMFKAPLAWGIAPWPPSGEEHFIIVFERPLGNRIQVGTIDKPTPLREERLTRTLIRPFIQLLSELSRRGLTHRAWCEPGTLPGPSTRSRCWCRTSWGGTAPEYEPPGPRFCRSPGRPGRNW